MLEWGVDSIFTLYLWGLVGGVTVIVSSLILILYPISFFDPQRRLAHSLGTFWANCLIRLNPYWRLRVVGKNRIRKNQSYVLVSNHLSLADIVSLFSMGHPFKWVAKKSLFRVPFLGWAMSVMRYIPLERGRHWSIRKSYQEALEWLRRDESILIFPEGTRSRTGEMGNFKRGAFRLALESGRPLVPVVLAGTQNVISKGNLSFGKLGLAYMSILPPIETKDSSLDEGELRKKVERLMRGELKKRNRMLGRLQRF